MVTGINYWYYPGQ